MRTQLTSMIEEYRAVTSRLDAIAAEVAAVTASAQSAEGCVRATVGPHGQLTELTIDAGIAERFDSGALAARVLEATRLATAQVREHVRAIVHDRLPESLRPLASPEGTVDMRGILPADPGELTRSWSDR